MRAGQNIDIFGTRCPGILRGTCFVGQLGFRGNISMVFYGHCVYQHNWGGTTTQQIQAACPVWTGNPAAKVAAQGLLSLTSSSSSETFGERTGVHTPTRNDGLDGLLCSFTETIRNAKLDRKKYAKVWVFKLLLALESWEMSLSSLLFSASSVNIDSNCASATSANFAVAPGKSDGMCLKIWDTGIPIKLWHLPYFMGTSIPVSHIP